MANRITLVAAVTAVSLCLAPTAVALAQEAAGGRIRLGIGTIEYRAPNQDRRAGEDTRAFEDMLTTALVKTGTFDVIERQRMESILQEQQMGSAGLTDGYDVLRVSGVDYLLIGSITQLGFTQGRAGLFSSWDTYKSQMTMAVDVRVVDVENGLAVIADTVSVEVDGPGADDEYEMRQRMERERTIILGDVMRSVSTDIVFLIVSQVHPIRVATKTSGGEVILNYGDGLLTKGHTLHVYSEGESFTDPATGEVLGSEEQLVARVSVIRAESRFSRAQILSEYSPIEAGMVARIVWVEPE